MKLTNPLSSAEIQHDSRYTVSRSVYFHGVDRVNGNRQFFPWSLSGWNLKLTNPLSSAEIQHDYRYTVSRSVYFHGVDRGKFSSPLRGPRIIPSQIIRFNIFLPSTHWSPEWFFRLGLPHMPHLPILPHVITQITYGEEYNRKLLIMYFSPVTC